MSEQRRAPIETDALGAVHKELIMAARRQKAARLRRRRLATIAATVLVALVCVAGAGALTNVGTGVGVIDRLLGEREEQIPDETRPAAALSALDAQPKPGTTAVTIAVPWPSMPTKAIASLYVSQGDLICFALARPSRAGIHPVTGSRGNCALPIAISRRLALRAVFVSGISTGRVTMVHGYLTPDVRDVSVRGPGGEFTVRTSGVWKPATDDTTAMRLFVASKNVGAAEGGRSAEESGRILDLRRYEVRARMADGRVVQIPPVDFTPPTDEPGT